MTELIMLNTPAEDLTDETPSKVEAPADDKPNAREIWEQLKTELQPLEWTVGESATYYAFFLHGWHSHANAARSPVDEALKELREMFPGLTSQIRHRASTDGSKSFQIVIHDWNVPSDIPCRFNETAPTLDEAMVRVRQYYQEQIKKEN